MDRNILITAAVSAAIHIVGMSVVLIVNPASEMEIRPYTKVSFLGPLLNKTAFDIMLENKSQVFKTRYNYFDDAPQGYLDLSARSPQKYVPRDAIQGYESFDDDGLKGFLAGNKIIPYFMLDSEPPKIDNNVSRGIVYKPENIGAVNGLVNSAAHLKIRVKVFIAPDGRIRNSEPVTTTGNPDLDHVILLYVNNWVFEQSPEGKEETKEIDIVLMRGADNDKT
jgi:hypothetical protein